jgi:predicted DNA-binding transcriptional regulator YafY
MNRTDRLHAIVEDLRRAGARGRTSEQLAARFEVSTRTVKRDVSALQQAGHPIWATGGPGGGYVLDAAATLPPVNFTAGEAVAVAVALGRRPDLPFAVDGRSALAKVLDAMSPIQRARAERLGRKVWVRPTGLPSGPVVRAIEQALADEVVLALDYVDREGRATRRREVEPIYLGIDDGRWWLFAWDRGRGAGRTFRVDRIARADATTVPAAPPSFEEAFGRRPPEGVSPSL